MARKKVGVFSLGHRVEEPLATAEPLQPWLVLVNPPLEALAELGAGRPNGSLRVLVAALDDPQDAVTGSVVFEDALDQGLLAAVQLDKDMSWPFRPVEFRDPDDESAAVDDVHRLLRLRGEGAVPARAGAAHPLSAAPPEGAIEWPSDRPPTWPPGRSWPPEGGDPRSHRGICSVFPCCWGCPPNSKC